MQISVISASHRRKSESARIAEIISLRLIQINNNIKPWYSFKNNGKLNI